MPASLMNQTIYIDKFGSIDKINAASLYKPGELGSREFDVAGRGWQLVVTDSGPTSIAAGDLAFWVSKSAYKVTNKLADAPEGRNAVAGIFTVTVTPGYYTCIQRLGASIVTVNSAGSPAIGDIAIANSGTNKDSTPIAAGTAPTYLPLGVYSSTATSSKASIDLNAGEVVT